MHFFEIKLFSFFIYFAVGYGVLKCFPGGVVSSLRPFHLVGDTAEVENYYWWGDEITAVLESIKNEPQSGGKNKVLTFTVSGGVEPGTNLNLSLGQKSARYDALVPNSAVRNDANGSFVLVLTTKSTPLGNRYVATRVDVKVLASDDVNSAVSGISNGDYVITTSSKPIESGTLVRMAEG